MVSQTLPNFTITRRFWLFYNWESLNRSQIFQFHFMLHHHPFFETSPHESQIMRQFEQQNFSISLWTTKADIELGCFFINNHIYHPYVKEGPPKSYFFNKSGCYWLKNSEFRFEPKRWTKILVVFPSITTKITRWKRGTMKDAFFQQKVWVTSR